MKATYNHILKILGNVIMLEAEGVAYGELALIKAKQGASLAEVIRIEGKEVYLQVFSGSAGISTDDEVQFLSHGMQAPFSEALIGRVFDGKGEQPHAMNRAGEDRSGQEEACRQADRNRRARPEIRSMDQRGVAHRAVGIGLW